MSSSMAVKKACRAWTAGETVSLGDSGKRVGTGELGLWRGQTERLSWRRKMPMSL